MAKRQVRDETYTCPRSSFPAASGCLRGGSSARNDTDIGQLPREWSLKCRVADPKSPTRSDLTPCSDISTSNSGGREECSPTSVLDRAPSSFEDESTVSTSESRHLLLVSQPSLARRSSPIKSIEQTRTLYYEEGENLEFELLGDSPPRPPSLVRLSIASSTTRQHSHHPRPSKRTRPSDPVARLLMSQSCLEGSELVSCAI